MRASESIPPDQERRADVGAVRHRSGVQSVVRTLHILFELTSAEEPVPVGLLAAQVGLPRPTVYRLAQTLMAEGLVMRLDGGLVVTPRCALMMTGKRIQVGLRHVVDPYLHRLVESSGETSGAHTRTGLVRRCIAEVEGLQGVRWMRGVGFAAPIWSGAVGHVFMGAMSDERIEEILANADITPTARNSVTDPVRLKRLALDAREKGWSGSSNETVDGACAIAAPMADCTGEIAAVLTLYAPSSRYAQLLALTEVLRATADEAAQQWSVISALPEGGANSPAVAPSAPS